MILKAYFKAINLLAVEFALTPLISPGRTLPAEADTNVNTEPSNVVTSTSPAVPIYNPPAMKGNE